MDNTLSVISCLIVVCSVVPLAYVLSHRAPAVTTFYGFVIASVVHLLSGGIRYALLGTWAPDAGNYHKLGIIAAATYRNGGSFDYSTGKEGWPRFLGLVYWMIGPHPLSIILLASISVPVSAWLAGRSAQIIGGDRAARVAFIFVAGCPVFLIWGDSLLREAACWLMMGLALLGFLQFTRESKKLGLWPLLLGIAGLFAVRGTLVILLIFGLAAGLLVSTVLKRDGHRLPAVALIVALTVIGPTLITTFAGQYGFDLDSVNRSRAELSTIAHTSFGVVNNYSSINDIFIGSITSLPRAIAGPFPWEWSLGSQLLLAADAMLWWSILYVLWVGRRGYGRRNLFLIGLPALAVLIPLAATSGNYGTLIRLRVMALYILVPLIATAWVDYRKRRRSVEDRRGPAASTTRPPKLPDQLSTEQR